MNAIAVFTGAKAAIKMDPLQALIRSFCYWVNSSEPTTPPQVNATLAIGEHPGPLFLDASEAKLCSESKESGLFEHG